MTVTGEDVTAVEVPVAATGWRRAVARTLTEVFAPWALIIGMCAAVGWHADRWTGVGWGLLAALFASAGPMLFILAGVRSGRFSDHHLTNREHRMVPLLVIIGLVITGVVVSAVAGAPRDIVAGELAMLATLAVTAPITALWKISFHTAVAAGACGILIVVYGPALAVTAPLIVAIGWSRVLLRDHTLAQVTAGAPVGAIAATLAFIAARAGL